MAAIKLHHRSGWVNCRPHGKSFWGCDDSERISMAITDKENHVLFPKALNYNGWVRIEGYDGRTSEELVLPPVHRDTACVRGTEWRVWYGSDLKNRSEHDNRGMSCVDVYAKVRNVNKPAGSVILRLSFLIAERWEPFLEDPTSLDYYEKARNISESVSRYFIGSFARNFDKAIMDGMDILKSLRFPVVRLSRSKDGSAMSVTADVTEMNSERTPGGFCGDVLKFANDMKLSNSLGKVEYTSYGCCEHDTIGDETFKGSYRFNATSVGSEIKIPCAYNTNATLTRKCVASIGSGRAKWEPPNLSLCLPKSRTTADLMDLNTTSHATSDGLLVAKKLNAVIRTPLEIRSPEDMKLISDITSTIVRKVPSKVQSVELVDNIVEVYNKILDVDPSIVLRSEETKSASTALIRNMETLSESVGRILHVSSLNNISTSKPNIGVQIAKVQTIRDVRISSKFDTNHRVSVGIDNHAYVEQPTDLLASVYIPRETFGEDDGLVYSQAYLKNTLFVPTPQNKSRKHVQSLVLSVSIERTYVSHLEEPIVLQFVKRSALDYSSTCSYWSFVSRSWETSGCWLVNQTTKGLVTCKCNHLTNFAILMDVYQTGNNPESLQIITNIGCAVSLIGLLITILIYSFFKPLRAKIPSKMMLCLCVSQCCFIVVFLFGIERTGNGTLCGVITGFLHYLLLASFAWMLAIGVNLFQLLVLVFRVGDEEKLFLGVSIGAWCVPLVIVIITFAALPHMYGDERFCFPQSSAAYFGVVLPIGIVLCVNMFLLGTIIFKFARSKPIGEIKQNVNQARIALSVTVLLGLTWTFAVFAIEDAEYVFQLLFCIFNSLQGFFICIFYTLTNKSVHQEVKGFLRKRFPKYSGLSGTDILTLNNANSSHSE